MASKVSLSTKAGKIPSAEKEMEEKVNELENPDLVDVVKAINEYQRKKEKETSPPKPTETSDRFTV